MNENIYEINLTQPNEEIIFIGSLYVGEKETIILDIEINYETKIINQSLPLFYLYTVPMLFKTCIKKVKNFKT